MSCNESCNKEVTQCKKNNNGCGSGNFVIVVVLYILLAIIIGSCII